MELKRTKLFSSICIILSAVAVIFTVLLVILLNLGIGYTAVEGDSGEQAAQAIVGVIFVALLLIVLCGVAVFSALSGSISLILASKGKRPKPLLITGAVIKFLSVPPLAVLPEIVKEVGDMMPIFVDCGICSGMDAYKALALGATAVSVGTHLIPYIRQGGAEAVAARMQEMNEELRGAMAYTGVKHTGEFDSSVLHRL